MTACAEDHDAIWQEGYVEGYADGMTDRPSRISQSVRTESE